MTHTLFPGGELRARRLELGFTVDDVYRKTRIATNHIEAIENGELRALPTSCYVNGFLKSYCHLLEMDADRFIDSFRAAARPEKKKFSFKHYAYFSSPPSWTGEVIAWALVCLVLLCAWTAYNIVVRPDSGPLDGRVQAGEPAPPPPSEKGIFDFSE